MNEDASVFEIISVDDMKFGIHGDGVGEGSCPQTRWRFRQTGGAVWTGSDAGMKTANVLPPTLMNHMVFPIDGPDGEMVMKNLYRTLECRVTFWLLHKLGRGQDGRPVVIRVVQDSVFQFGTSVPLAVQDKDSRGEPGRRPLHTSCLPSSTSG